MVGVVKDSAYWAYLIGAGMAAGALCAYRKFRETQQEAALSPPHGQKSFSPTGFLGAFLLMELALVGVTIFFLLQTPWFGVVLSSHGYFLGTIVGGISAIPLWRTPPSAGAFESWARTQLRGRRKWIALALLGWFLTSLMGKWDGYHPEASLLYALASTAIVGGLLALVLHEVDRRKG
jgi:hypothetical protein